MPVFSVLAPVVSDTYFTMLVNMPWSWDESTTSEGPRQPMHTEPLVVHAERQPERRQPGHIPGMVFMPMRHDRPTRGKRANHIEQFGAHAGEPGVHEHAVQQVRAHVVPQGAPAPAAEPETHDARLDLLDGEGHVNDRIFATTGSRG